MPMAAGQEHGSVAARMWRSRRTASSRQNRPQLGRRYRARPPRLGLAARQRAHPLRQGAVLFAMPCQGKIPRVARETNTRDIAALNRDWGNQFWSQLYQRFEQIRSAEREGVPRAVQPAPDARRAALVCATKPPTTCGFRRTSCGNIAARPSGSRRTTFTIPWP